MTEHWPRHLPVAQVRVARSTSDLEQIRRFYRDGLGLTEIDAFDARDGGYEGVVLGLPSSTYHLEFTYRPDSRAPAQAPGPDHQLVFYMQGPDERDRLAARMIDHGYEPVPAANPYWRTDGITFQDFEGWRVVLMGRRYS